MSESGPTPWERELLDLDFRPPGFYHSMTPEFASQEYGFPPASADEFTAYDGSIWSYDRGAGHWVMVNYPPTGDPYLVVKQRERGAGGV